LPENHFAAFGRHAPRARRSEWRLEYLRVVMRGLDPRIHLPRENDGLPDQARQRQRNGIDPEITNGMGLER
jgi:hypothetical protein